MDQNIYSFTAQNGQGQMIPLSTFKGKVLLVVNTASRCGFTPQYEGLEELYKAYHQRGLEILAFPCNQFGQQEPGSNEEILSFCEMNYHITFPVMAKIDVNGDQADPFYEYLKTKAPGLLGSKAIKWNFTKFLINAQGEVVERYAPQTTPKDLAKDIEKYLPTVSS
jgi:glutathione peroxidase